MDSTEGALRLNMEEGLQEDVLGGRGRVQEIEDERSPHCLEAVGGRRGSRRESKEAGPRGPGIREAVIQRGDRSQRALARG